MPCKTQIKSLVENLVEELTLPGLSMSLPNATLLAAKTNIDFQHNVVYFYNDKGKVARNINVPSELIDTYYDQQLIRQTAVNSNTSVSALETDIKNLNLTPDVVSYLYDTSRSKSIGRTIDNYTKQVNKLVNNLQTSFSNEEIIEKIKCL
jgi:hypothetical protein